MAGWTQCQSDHIGCDSAGVVFRRVLWVALAANLAMFVVELIASRLSDSISLQADALDFFGDAANYAVSLFVVGMAVTARARASLFKSATMALFGAWVLGSALHRAIAGSSPEPMTMSVVALLALLVNLGVAAMLFRFRNGDSNRQSIWLCSRNDAIGNLAVMLAAASVFATGTRWPDLLVAAVIAGLNISAALHVIELARAELRAGLEIGNEAEVRAANPAVPISGVPSASADGGPTSG